MRQRSAVLLFLTILCPLVAAATTIPVSSYSMFNGGTGSFTYQDTSYLPCPASNCTTTGAPLSGGTGKLTDGISPATDWTAGDPEPWVGWANNETNGTNPTVTFFFSGLPTINSVTVWFDNTLSGGVGAPSSISVDGTNYTGIPQTTTGPQAFVISGLNITGSSIDVQFFQSNSWIMIGEVTFDGTISSTTPEPATLALLGSGLLSVAGFLRRKLLTQL